MARPSKYDSHVKPKLIAIEGWARQGLSDEQIAHNLGISHNAYYKYKKLYKEFSEALKRGKAVADFEVENAMFRNALGYEYEEVTEETIDNEDGCYTKIRKTRKHMKPDTTAQIFWLKNRMPNEWREKQHMNIDHSGNVDVANTFKGLSKKDLEELAKHGDN